MKKSLSERLVSYLRNQGSWIASGELQRLAMNAGYTAQNAGRRLREEVEAGFLEVEYRKPRNHAYYRYVSQAKKVQKVDIIDGRAVISYEEVMN